MQYPSDLRCPPPPPKTKIIIPRNEKILPSPTPALKTPLTVLRRFILYAEGPLEVLSLQKPFFWLKRYCGSTGGRKGANQKQTTHKMKRYTGPCPPSRYRGHFLLSLPPPPPLSHSLVPPAPERPLVRLRQKICQPESRSCQAIPEITWLSLIFRGNYPQLLLHILLLFTHGGWLPLFAINKRTRCASPPRKKAHATLSPFSPVPSCLRSQ